MPDLSFENQCGFADGRVVCGVDEVGRGPLAGPVVAAAAILPPGGLPPELAVLVQDSKLLNDRKREALFPALTRLCRFALGEASVDEIAAQNILQASLLAMRRAVAGLGVTPDHALVDGNRLPTLDCPATAIIKGDGLSLSIAAASVIAKVTRDRMMRQLAERHPGYGWERNAGYGTAEHLEALRRLGPTCWHRMGFAPVAAVAGLGGGS